MFTGLVEEVGSIISIHKGEKSAQIVIKAHRVLENVRLGDSIAVNGVCLTVTDFSPSAFNVDVMAETIRKTNLKDLSPGSTINLERALRLGDRLGGHLVSGHIDGVGTLKNFHKEDNAVWITIGASADLLKYIIPKGSIAIDGVSLTVAFVDDKLFKVSIIPHTKEATTLLTKAVGSPVNLECDMIGKYIEKFISHKEAPSPQRSLDMEFLTKHGFA